MKQILEAAKEFQDLIEEKNCKLRFIDGISLQALCFGWMKYICVLRIVLLFRTARILILAVSIGLLNACSTGIYEQRAVENNSDPIPASTPAPDLVKERKSLVSDKSIPIVKPSNIIDLIKVKVTQSKGNTPKQVADFANEVLKKSGYDFTFDWLPKGKINQANLARIGEDYYPFYHSLIDSTGKKREFQFMNDNFGHPCFSVIDVPVTKVSERKVTIVSDSQEVDLIMPKDFGHEEMVLVDKDLKTQIRKWITPIDATPVGISANGKKIYFNTWEFYQNQNEAYAEQPIRLAIELSVDGALRFVDVKEVPSDKGIVIDHGRKYSEITFKRYEVGGKQYIVKFSAPCT